MEMEKHVLAETQDFSASFLKPPVKCMVQNETRGFSFRKNSKKMARVQNLGWFFCICWFVFCRMMMMKTVANRLSVYEL